MAESYSTSLKLTIIGAGDLAGTWGNVTNANLGTLLEQAITGVQAVGLSGSTYTLTNINGALDDARNAVLVFSGASSPCTIVCPGGSANKIYTVVNQCSVALTMTASGGSASLVIPAGMTSQVYLDGTNQTGSGIGVYSSLNGVPNSFTVTGNLTATGVTDVGNLSVTGTTTLTGTATAPTPTVGDNSTKIATTAFVATATSSLGTMASQNANNVTITGGSINGVSGTNSGLSVGSATNATNATNATKITNSGGWNVTPTGTKLYFNYNGTNVGSLDSSGNFIVIGNVTAYGTP